MAYVVEEAGARVITLPGLSREISPLRDLIAVVRLARLIRRYRPVILHTHTAKAGTVGRAAALIAGDARPPIVIHTFHGHVLRGYFSPAKTSFFRVLERLLAKVTTVLIAVSPEVRDDLVALGVARARSLRSSGSGSSSRNASAPTSRARRSAAVSAFRRNASSSAGSAA